MSQPVRYKYPLQLPISQKETAARLARKTGCPSISGSPPR